MHTAETLEFLIIKRLDPDAASCNAGVKNSGVLTEATRLRVHLHSDLDVTTHFINFPTSSDHPV